MSDPYTGTVVFLLLVMGFGGLALGFSWGYKKGYDHGQLDAAEHRGPQDPSQR